MTEEGAVRDVITNDLTGIKAARLLSHAKREKLKGRIVKDLRAHTDIKLKAVLFSDLTIQ